MRYAVVVVYGEEFMRFEANEAWYRHPLAIGKLVALGLRFAPPEVVRERVQEVINSFAPPVNWVARGDTLTVWQRDKSVTIP